MKKGLSEFWHAWRARVSRKAEQLVDDYSAAPVPLAGVAQRCGIQETIFRPLLVDGALAKRDNGFAMYVRCERNQADDLRRRFDDPTDAGRHFLPQMRFTIAHEIVHTFFYDVGEGMPVPRVAATHYRQLLSLERECNRGAARLLLPTELLKDELAKSGVDLFSPSAIRRIASLFRVSVETLIHRLEPLGVWTTTPGAIWFVKPNDVGEMRIKAARVHAMTGRFATARGQDPASIFYDNRLLLYGGRETAVVADGWMARCEPAGPSANAILLSISRVDAPSVPQQRNLVGAVLAPAFTIRRVGGLLLDRR